MLFLLNIENTILILGCFLLLFNSLWRTLMLMEALKGQNVISFRDTKG